MMTASSDRSVHAVGKYGTEIVRYDRSGKWYAESKGSKRRPVTLKEAVRLASQDGFEVYLDLPGGRLFDAAYRVTASETVSFPCPLTH